MFLPGDSMTTLHDGMPWSTFDSDNDRDDKNCAEDLHGAWWYSVCQIDTIDCLYDKEALCQTSNLNGPYVSPEHGIKWSSWPISDGLLAEVNMKIRPSHVGWTAVAAAGSRIISIKDQQEQQQQQHHHHHHISQQHHHIIISSSNCSSSSSMYHSSVVVVVVVVVALTASLYKSSSTIPAALAAALYNSM